MDGCDGAKGLLSPLAEADVSLGCDLSNLLEGQERRVVQLLRQSGSLDAFFAELLHLLRMVLQCSRPVSQDLPATRFLRNLMQDLERLGWQHVTGIAPDLSWLKLSKRDAAGRSHGLTVLLSTGDSSCSEGSCLQQAQVVADLPLPLRWPPAAAAASGAAGGDCVQLMACFEEALQQYQPLWDTLDDLDANAVVLEPETPGRASSLRRISLGGFLSLQLELDPLNPGAYPASMLWFGSEAAVSRLRQKAQQRRHRWDPCRLLRHNLEALLDQALPRRPTAEADAGEEAGEIQGECSICYSYHLHDAAHPDKTGPAPTIHCSDPKCGRGFHQRCLADWLQSNPTSRTSFRTVFGQCPFCQSTVAVSTDLCTS